MLRRAFVRYGVASALFIVMMTLLAFWSVFTHFFISVDFAFLYHASVGELLSLERYSGQFYRPAEDFLWTILFSVFDLKPQYYYGVTLAVHVINGFLILQLGQRVLRDALKALLAAVCFVTFSVANEAVFWMSANLNEGVYTMFLLISLIFYIKFLGQGLRRSFVASIAFFVASLLAKETALVGPLLICATGWMFHLPNRIALRRSVPFAIIAAGFAVARGYNWLGGEFATQGMYRLGPHIVLNLAAYGGSIATLGALTTLARFGGNYRSMMEIGRFLMPFATVLGAGLIIALLIVLKSASRLTRYCVVWIFITLLPYAPLIYLQVRYMYAGTVGFALLLAGKIGPRKVSVLTNLKHFPITLRVLVITGIVVFGIVSNNIGSAYYGGMGSVYQNIIQDIRPQQGRFPEGSVLIFVDLPRVTSGNVISDLDRAVEVYYGQSVTVLATDSSTLQETVSRYQGKPVFVFRFDPATLHVSRITT